jgi:hypothetical protein
MAEHVYRPLGLAALGTDVASARGATVVQGHGYLFGWPTATDIDGADALPAPTHLAASPSELGRVLSVLLREGRYGDDFAWKSFAVDGTQGWYREGVSRGFRALVAVLPEADLGIVVLASRAGGPGPEAASELLRGVAARAIGLPGRPYVPWERFLHVALLILLTIAIAQPIRWYRRWKAMGRPRATAHTTPIVGRLVVELTLAAAVPLVIVLGVEKTSIIDLLRHHPDVAIAVIVLPLTTIPTSVWRTLVHSERWRRSRLSP